MNTALVRDLASHENWKKNGWLLRMFIMCISDRIVFVLSQARIESKWKLRSNTSRLLAINIKMFYGKMVKFESCHTNHRCADERAHTRHSPVDRFLTLLHNDHQHKIKIYSLFSIAQTTENITSLTFDCEHSHKFDIRIKKYHRKSFKKLVKFGI